MFGCLFCGAVAPIHKRLVIVGGGYAGKDLAVQSDPIFDVVWIDPKDFFLHKVGTIRAAVKPEWSPLMAVTKPELLLKRGKRIKAACTAVDSIHKTVTLSTGEVVNYDYLVIATGGVNTSICEPPASATDTTLLQQHFDEVSAIVKAAKKIVIVGGGAVGCELAGEIASRYPKTSLVLVHSGKALCDAEGQKLQPTPSFHKKIQTQLEAMKVKVILKTRAAVSSDVKFITGLPVVKLSNGDPIKDVDLVLVCTGFKPSTSFLPSEWLDDQSMRVKVNPQLQVEGHPDVLAIGDCNNHPAPKIAMLAGSKKGKMFFPLGQADVALDNLIALNRNQPLKAYADPRNKFAEIVTLGPKAYVVEGAPGFAGSYKAKNFFYSNHWTVKGVKAPPVPE